MIGRRALLGLAFVLLASGIGSPVATERRAYAADEDARASIASAIVAATTSGNGPALTKALADAMTSVGPSAAFPDMGALADWLGALPAPAPRNATVRTRRVWMYVVVRRSVDALELLAPLIAERPESALLRTYSADAYRQLGDVPRAIEAYGEALRLGADVEGTGASVLKLLFDLRASAPTGAAVRSTPAYVTAASPLYARTPMRAVRLAVLAWLGEDLSRANGDPSLAAVLARALAGELVAVAKIPSQNGDGARLAESAYAHARRMGTSVGAMEGDVTRFDVLSVAVRLGERPGGEGHLLPEALVDLAEEALAKGRYGLADRLARRRLQISDSPAARGVLRALPPDVGD